MKFGFVIYWHVSLSVILSTSLKPPTWVVLEIFQTWRQKRKVRFLNYSWDVQKTWKWTAIDFCVWLSLGRIRRKWFQVMALFGFIGHVATWIDACARERLDPCPLQQKVDSWLPTKVVVQVYVCVIVHPSLYSPRMCWYSIYEISSGESIFAFDINAFAVFYINGPIC